jgi:hypothetical protein
VLDKRQLKPTAQQRDRVTGSGNLAELERWFDRALTATAAADVFAD